MCPYSKGLVPQSWNTSNGISLLDILRMPIFGIWNSYVEAIASLLPCAFLAHIWVPDSITLGNGFRYLGYPIISQGNGFHYASELTTTSNTHIAYMQGTTKECE
jgi:hypothetical protein